jgi:hypothetical protein
MIARELINVATLFAEIAEWPDSPEEATSAVCLPALAGMVKMNLRMYRENIHSPSAGVVRLALEVPEFLNKCFPREIFTSYFKPCRYWR